MRTNAVFFIDNDNGIAVIGAHGGVFAAPTRNLHVRQDGILTADPIVGQWGCVLAVEGVAVVAHTPLCLAVAVIGTNTIREVSWPTMSPLGLLTVPAGRFPVTSTSILLVGARAASMKPSPSAAHSD